MLTMEQVQKILIAALRDKLLILTVNLKTSREMCEDIYDYMKFRGVGGAMAQYSAGKCYGEIIFKGGFEDIYIMPVDKWNAEKRLPFRGRVFVTNRKITDIKYISTVPIPLTAILEGEKNGTA